jgi:hypothetical protein
MSFLDIAKELKLKFFEFQGSWVFVVYTLGVLEYIPSCIPEQTQTQLEEKKMRKNWM